MTHRHVSRREKRKAKRERARIARLAKEKPMLWHFYIPPRDAGQAARWGEYKRQSDAAHAKCSKSMMTTFYGWMEADPRVRVPAHGIDYTGGSEA